MARAYFDESEIVGRRFAKALENTIETLGNKPREDNVTHKSYIPSSMVCTRNMWYRKMGYPKDKKRNSIQIRIGESGTDAHKRLQEYACKMVECGEPWVFYDVEAYIKENNLDLVIVEKTEYEIKLYSPKWDISFLCDGIMLNTETNEFYIIEFKTETQGKFYSHKDIREIHISQIAAYSLLLNTRNIICLYESRDFCMHKCFVTTIKEHEIKKYVTDKIKYVNKCLDDGILADISDMEEEIQVEACKYCAYAKQCKNDTKAQIKENKGKVK